MRPPGEIKRQLLVLRDLRHLPYSHMAEHSRCSRDQIMSALQLEATEDVLVRLDAYLDAKHLHVRKRSSELLWRYERNDRELFRMFGAKSFHSLTVQEMPQDKVRRMIDAMDYRLKNLFHRYLQLKGVKAALPDGLSYWAWKAKICKKHQDIRLGLADGDACRLLRADPMGQSRFLQRRQDANG